MAAILDTPQFFPLYADQTEALIRARWNAWLNEGTAPSDEVNWTNVREGAIAQILTQPGVRESARIYDLMGTEVPMASNPLWAWESYLDDAAEVVRVDRKAGVPAHCNSVIITGPVGTLIPAGSQVTTVPTTPESDDALEYNLDAPVTTQAHYGPPLTPAAVLQVGGTLTFSTTYRYVVTAFDMWGQESTPCAEVTVTVASSGTSRQARITWTSPTVPSGGAVNGYFIYRKTGGAAGPPYNFIGQVSAGVLAFTDTNSVGENSTLHPPATDGTGGKVFAAVTAVAAGPEYDKPIGALNQLVPPIDNVSAYNSSPAIGGASTESDPDLRERVLGRYDRQGAGNVFDYQGWALEEPGVGRVTVVPLWNGPGTVKVVVMDRQGQPVPQTILDSLTARLDPVPGQGKGLAPVGAVVTVTTAEGINITVVASVNPEPGYSVDDHADGRVVLRPLIEAAVLRYVQSIGSGGFVVYEQIKGRIVTVQGVHTISSVTVNGDVLDVFIDTNPAQTPQLVTPLTLTEV
jgi:uncharacterized phage protein gp47/JayE